MEKIIGDRVILRPYTIEDADDMFNNFGSDEEITKYMLRKKYETVDDARKAINYYIKCYNSDSNFTEYAIELKKTGDLIGSIGIEVNKRHNHGELGYLLSRKMQRKGLMTEAINLLCDYYFSKGLIRISADVMTENIGSIRLLEKCGFNLEGISKNKYIDKNGKYVDVCIYAKIV